MPQSKLYLLVGYPGAGKTTIAKLISEANGAVHLWADVERHKMFDNPQHTEIESKQLYDQLNVRAEELLASGKSVIFDTSFNHKRDRDLLREIANRHGAETVVVWMSTPLEIAKDRAVHSNIVRNNYDFTMSPEQFDAIAEKLEPPQENEKVIKIDGTNIDPAEAAGILGV